jgi:hypothetical protein
MSIRDEIHLGLLDQRALTGRLGRHDWNHSQRQEKDFIHEAMVHGGGGLNLIEPLRLQEVTEKSPRRKQNGKLSRNTP